MNTELIVPIILVVVSGYCIYKKVDFFAAFLSGAKEGLASSASVLPALCLLMTAVGMIRASGAPEWLSKVFSSFIKESIFPPEVLPLALLRPFSGSGALAYYKELCIELPPDGYAAKVASVLMGGSETTFYTIAVYYGAVGIKKTKNTVFAALCADFAAAILSAVAVKLLI